MPRALGSKVPKTSGQGVSRFSYQKGYALGNKGSGGLADFSSGTHDKAQRTQYAKSGKDAKDKKAAKPDFTDLPEKPPRSGVPDKRKKAHEYPKGG